MLLLDLIEWIFHNPGEALFRGLLLIVARNLIHIAKEEEIHWLRESVERLTGEKYPGHTKQLWGRAVRSSKWLYNLSPKDMYRAKALRRKPMKNFLTSSSFRRWLSFIIATVIPIVNQRFGWNLDANEVIGIILLAAAHILGEAHFDGKKAVNAATSAINSALQASTVANPGSTIPQVTAPPMTYQEMLPYIQSVHKAVNGAYAAVQSGKFTDATQDAADFYMAVHGYLQALQSDQSKGA